jgi:hypothetical protein
MDKLLEHGNRTTSYARSSMLDLRADVQAQGVPRQQHFTRPHRDVPRKLIYPQTIAPRCATRVTKALMCVCRACCALSGQILFLSERTMLSVYMSACSSGGLQMYQRGAVRCACALSGGLVALRALRAGLSLADPAWAVCGYNVTVLPHGRCRGGSCGVGSSCACRGLGVQCCTGPSQLAWLSEWAMPLALKLSVKRVCSGGGSSSGHFLRRFLVGRGTLDIISGLGVAAVLGSTHRRHMR